MKTVHIDATYGVTDTTTLTVSVEGQIIHTETDVVGVSEDASACVALLQALQEVDVIELDPSKSARSEWGVD